MKKKKYIIICAIAICLTVIVIINPLALSDPDYKLHETIRDQFRPEWQWNKDTREYDNIGDLIRDPETGLFPEPETKNNELEGYAMWDGLLGLYICNDIKINHETGEIKSEIVNNNYNTVEFPCYQLDSSDPIDKKYMDYQEILRSIDDDPSSSLYYSPQALIENGQIKEEFFIMPISNVGVLKEKLSLGLQSDFVMTSLQITTNVKMNNIPSNGAAYKLKYWLEEYNELINKANTGFNPEKAETLGFLALPYIEDQIREDHFEKFAPILPSVIDGFEGCEAKDLNIENKSEVLSWFKENKKEIDMLREFISNELEANWLYTS